MMPSRRHNGIGRALGLRWSGPAGCAPPSDDGAAAFERGQLRLHLGQPGAVARHQECVVLDGEVAGLALTVGVGQGPLQELTLVGQVPAFLARRAIRPPRLA